MMRALLWKEWRQQGWQIALGCFLLLGITLVGLQTRLIPDEETINFACFVGAFGLTILVTMGLIAPERADGSLRMMLSLPASAQRVYWAKIAMGTLACLAPLALNCLAAVALAGNRELLTSSILGLHGFYALLGWLLFAWTIGFSTRMEQEAKVALTGFFILLGWVLSFFLLMMLFSKGGAMIVSPISLPFFNDSRHFSGWFPFALVFHLAVAYGLLSWGARRFGTSERTTR